MIYLVLAMITSMLVSVFMRLSEKYITNKMAMFMSNYAICVVLSILFMDWSFLIRLSAAGTGIADTNTISFGSKPTF